MKKDEKYLKENLASGILRMKHDGRMENIREQKVAEIPERVYRKCGLGNFLE